MAESLISPLVKKRGNFATKIVTVDGKIGRVVVSVKTKMILKHA